MSKSLRPSKSNSSKLCKNDYTSTSNSEHGQISKCSLCNLVFYNNPPFAHSSWLKIVYETIKLLHEEAVPHQKYFHYKHDICSYIDRHWNKLCPEKKRTLTWNNTVSAVITTHRKLFKSNSRQSGYWTLLPPPGIQVNSDFDSEDENIDYVERAKEIKAKNKTKKRKHDEISMPATPHTPNNQIYNHSVSPVYVEAPLTSSVPVTQPSLTIRTPSKLTLSSSIASSNTPNSSNHTKNTNTTSLNAYHSPSHSMSSQTHQTLQINQNQPSINSSINIDSSKVNNTVNLTNKVKKSASYPDFAASRMTLNVWNRPVAAQHDQSDSGPQYTPISVRRKFRPPVTPYFARAHMKLQATADKRALEKQQTSNGINNGLNTNSINNNVSSSIETDDNLSNNSPLLNGNGIEVDHDSVASSNLDSSNSVGSSKLVSMEAETSSSASSSSTSSLHIQSNSPSSSDSLTPSTPGVDQTQEHTLDFSMEISTTTTQNDSILSNQSTSNTKITGLKLSTKMTAHQSLASSQSSCSSPIVSNSSHTTSTTCSPSPIAPVSGARLAKINATNNLMVATAGLNSSSNSFAIILKSNQASPYARCSNNPTNNTHSDSTQVTTRSHPQVLDPVIIPIPFGWFERSFKHPSLRKKSIPAHEIPLPVWKELDEETEKSLWEKLEHEPDDEDISEEKFLVLHKECEREERKIKKYG